MILSDVANFGKNLEFNELKRAARGILLNYDPPPRNYAAAGKEACNPKL
jgi:hypothetical protein